MKCKKCGSEIKDGNLFCVNCGTSIESNKVEEKNVKEKETNKDNNAKKATKNKFKIIIPIIAITVVLIVIGAVIFLNINNTNISNKQEQEQGTENSKVELGVNYNVVSDGQEVKSVGFVRFNTNTDYIMELGDYASESFTTTGNYAINGNVMTLTVNYDSSEQEETTTPYTEKIEILDDGTLEYTNRNNITYSFSKDAKEFGQDEEKTKTIIDIDKFIKELSYSSMSTVHNSNYGGDGYRSDNGFFNSDLTKSSFEVKNNGNETTYTITTKNKDSSNEPITLEIVVTDNNVLKEIKLSCTSTSMKVENIMLCAKEVEDALGYTLINARNYQIADKVEKELKLENYVSGENGKVIEKNQSVTIEDENENKTVMFTIGENSLEYKMIF